MDNPLLRFWASIPHDRFLSLAKHDPAQYRKVFEDYKLPWLPWVNDRMAGMGICEHMLRGYAVWRWALSVPSARAVKTLVKHSPIVEIGAGRGYWAHLAHKAGADNLAYDIQPGNPVVKPEAWPGLTQNFAGTCYDVQVGGPEMAAEHPGRTLFLCWPPYGEPMAADCLRQYAGKTLIYVGEHDGCTADDTFRAMVDEGWDEIESVGLPQWSMIHDHLWVYRRK